MASWVGIWVTVMKPGLWEQDLVVQLLLIGSILVFELREAVLKLIFQFFKIGLVLSA